MTFKKQLILAAFFASTALTACATTDHGSSGNAVEGDISIATLQSEFPQFSQANNFHLSDEQQQAIQAWPAGLSVDVYFGTWCHDSLREVPRFLEILQSNQQIDSKLIALNTTKSEPQGRAKGAGVKYTPTFIVRLNGEEIGRIIERPKHGLVEDINKMLSNAAG